MKCSFPTLPRQSLKRWVIVVLALGVFLAATSSTVHLPSIDSLTQAKPQPVLHCTVISHEGAYKLTQDTQGGKLTDSCIQINKSHVTLQGRRHTLRRNGATDSTAVSISHPRGVTDVTVRSVKTTGWNHGVHVSNGSEITIKHVDAWKNAEGITVWNSIHVVITDMRLTNNLFGLVVDRATSSRSRQYISNTTFLGLFYAVTSRMKRIKISMNPAPYPSVSASIGTLFWRQCSRVSVLSLFSMAA